MRDRVQIAKSSSLIREQWFYDDIYLGDASTGEVSLFVRHFIEYVTVKGRTHRKFATGMLRLADDDALRSWVDEHAARESGDPDGKNRRWVPASWRGAEWAGSIQNRPIRERPRTRASISAASVTRGATKKMNYCPDCGMRIGPTSKRCSKHAALARSRV